MRLGPLAPVGPPPKHEYQSRPVVIEDESDLTGRFVLRRFRVRLSQHPLSLGAISALILREWCETQWPSTWYRSEWSFDERTDTFSFKTPEQRFHFVIRWRGYDMSKERAQA